METEFAGPALPPQFVQRLESEIISDLSFQQVRFFGFAAAKHLDKRKHKARTKYVTSSSSSEESEASVQVKKSSKPKGASSEQDK